MLCICIIINFNFLRVIGCWENGGKQETIVAMRMLSIFHFFVLFFLAIMECKTNSNEPNIFLEFGFCWYYHMLHFSELPNSLNVHWIVHGATIPYSRNNFVVLFTHVELRLLDKRMLCGHFWYIFPENLWLCTIPTTDRSIGSTVCNFICQLLTVHRCTVGLEFLIMWYSVRIEMILASEVI